MAKLLDISIPIAENMLISIGKEVHRLQNNLPLAAISKALLLDDHDTPITGYHALKSLAYNIEMLADAALEYEESRRAGKRRQA